MIAVTRGRFCAQAGGESRETNQRSGTRGNVERALRNQNVWLTIAYVGLILLLTRTYA